MEFEASDLEIMPNMRAALLEVGYMNGEEAGSDLQTALTGDPSDMTEDIAQSEKQQDLDEEQLKEKRQYISSLKTELPDEEKLKEKKQEIASQKTEPLDEVLLKEKKQQVSSLKTEPLDQELLEKKQEQ